MKTKADNPEIIKSEFNNAMTEIIPVQYGAKEIKEFMRKSVLIGFLFSLIAVILLLLSIFFFKKTDTLENRYLINANRTFEMTKIDEPLATAEQIPDTKMKVDFSDQLTTKFIAGLPKPVADDKAANKEFTDFGNLASSLSSVNGKEVDLNDLKFQPVTNLSVNNEKRISIAPATETEKIYDDFEVERPAQVDLAELQSKIVYPQIALDSKIEGRVVVSVTILGNGKPSSVKIVESSSKILEKAAMDAVMKTNFIPAIQNGKPVKSKLTIPIQFTIK